VTIDLGCTHVALPVRDLAASIAFYERYADMQVVHRRVDDSAVAWLSDRTRPFVIVLIETAGAAHADGGLRGFSHLGVAVGSRAEVDRRVEQARAEGHEVLGPLDDGPPVGYWAFVADPDGNNLELSFGQEVGLTVERA
jgi:catechol 2,3-dioxygenase-like lactoylglutathione lyase family enzyme